MDSERGELLFLVRVWLPAEDVDRSGTWRGAVVDVKSGIRFYVTGTRDVAEFIDARVGAARVEREP